MGEALKKCGYLDWALVDVVSGLAKRAREECGESSKERKSDHFLCERSIRRDQANLVKCECHHPFQTAG